MLPWAWNLHKGEKKQTSHKHKCWYKEVNIYLEWKILQQITVVIVVLEIQFLIFWGLFKEFIRNT